MPSSLPILNPGRKLYCFSCEGFERMKIALVGEPPKLRKVITCHSCGRVQAHLVSWGGENRWVDEKFVDNLGFTVTFVMGAKAVAKGLRFEEKMTVTPSKRGGSSSNTTSTSTQATARSSRADDLRTNLGHPKLKSVMRYALVIPIILGILHLVLTIVGIYWNVYIWPFTLVWSAFAGMGVKTTVLAGIIASTIAIGLGLFGTVLMRRNR